MENVDLSKVKISKELKLKKAYLTFNLIILALSGLRATGNIFTTVNNYNMVQDINDDKEIDAISEIEFDDNRITLGSYSQDDLLNAKEAHIRLTNENDYSFLNNMPNLEKLVIDDYRTEPLEGLDGSNFTKNMDITIVNHNVLSSFSKDKYSFLSDISSINNLCLMAEGQYNGKYYCGLNIESAFLESLHNVHNLQMEINEDTLYNYHDLTHLDSLQLLGKPYDVAMYLNNKDITGLFEAGVRISTNDMETLIKANNDIEKIVNELNIDPNASEEEKLDRILGYIMKNYSYDPGVSNLLRENKEDDIDHDVFYGKGMLDGALNNETQICGNYAAVLKALLHSYGIDSSVVTSDTHAWNLVKIGDEYHYIDATVMDGTISDEGVCFQQMVYTAELPNGKITEFRGTVPEEGKIISSRSEISGMSLESALEDGRNLNDVFLYVKDPLKYNSSNPYVIPVDAVVDNPSLKDAKIIDMTDKNYVLKIHGTVICVNAAVLIAILITLGLARKLGKIYKKQEKEEIEKKGIK